MGRDQNVRALFGVVSLLVVLAVIGHLATKQLGANQLAIAPAPSSASATVREQSLQLQERARSDVTKALEQGAARNDDASK